MPFITEEIWQAIPHAGKFLISAEWPVYREEFGIRRGRSRYGADHRGHPPPFARAGAEMNVPMSKKVNLTIAASQPEVFEAGKPRLLPASGRRGGCEGLRHGSGGGCLWR